MRIPTRTLKQSRRVLYRLAGLAFSALLALTNNTRAVADQGPRDAKQAEAGPLGTWRGESKCVVKPSGCHDEDSVYRISASGQSQDRVTLSGNKIVDGKEVNMGSGDCAYDAKARSLECPLPNGSSIHLELNGNVLEGKMTLRDGTLWRKISLHREERK